MARPDRSDSGEGKIRRSPRNMRELQSTAVPAVHSTDQCLLAPPVANMISSLPTRPLCVVLVFIMSKILS